MHNRTSRSRAALALCAVAALAASTLRARADSVTWTNAGTDVWTNAANWTPHAPNNGDDVRNNLATSIIQFNTNISVNSLLSAGELDINSGTLSGSLPGGISIVKVDNAFSINGGGLSNLTINSTVNTALSYSANGGNALDSVLLNANISSNAASSYIQLFNTNTLNATWNLSTTSNGIQLRDGNANLIISSTGSLRGFGQVFETFGGSTLTNNGLISADTANQTLALNNSNITGNGTFAATNGGTLSFGGTLNGAGASIAPDATSTVIINGGGVTGNIASSTGSGISFAGNANNFLSNANIAGNLTFTGNAYVQVFNTNTVSGTIAMSGTSNGIQLRDGNANLILSTTATLRGFGLVFQTFGGATLTNNGLVSADTAGKTLTLNNSNITGNGTFSAANGGTLAIGGTLNGNGASITPDATSTVLIDGGSVTGNFASSTGSGISFAGNGNNVLSNANISGNLTFTGNAYVQVFNTNTVGGAIAMSGTSNGIQLRDGNANLTLSPTATLHGFGLVFETFGGSTLTNNGLVSADTNAQTLTLNNSNITGNGTFEGKNGGTLAIGGSLNGSNATIHGDTGTVLINGGNVTGSYAASTGSGISFAGNGNNRMDTASINGNLTFTGAAFVQVFNANTVAGTIAMSGTSNGIQLRDGNANLTLSPTATMRGFGVVFETFGGSTFTNNGLVSADINGQTLSLNNSNINGNGTFAAANGGTLSIAGLLNGNGTSVAPDFGSTVLINGGGVTGNIASATGSGISFAGNGNNRMDTASISGNLTFTGNAYVQVFNANTINGVINMSTTSNGIQLRDGNASLILNGTLRGSGQVFQTFGGGQLINHGLIAPGAGQTLALNQSTTLSDGHITVPTASTLSVGGTLSQSAGETSVNGTLALANPFTITGGLLSGTGTITGNVINSGGTASPGNSPGLLTIAGSYEQDAAASLMIELAGHTPGLTYDQLDTTTSQIAGTLDVNQISNFIPQIGDTYDILTYNSHSGIFANLTSDTGLTYHVLYLSDRARIVIDNVTLVPEPASLTLLALGATGLLTRRKHR